MDKLEEAHYFVTPIYVIKKTEFLERVKEISDRYLEEAKKEGTRKMTVMTGGYAHEPSISDFTKYVSQTAWNILNSQGYAMDTVYTFFQEMWTQEHNSFSSMDTHVHGNRAQISCFYFLTTPKNGCQMLIHDPRPTKMMINLPQKDESKVTMATPHLVITPQEGLMVFTNAWIPHSFSKNFSQESCQFVHMNLSVAALPPKEEGLDDKNNSCSSCENKANCTNENCGCKKQDGNTHLDEAVKADSDVKE